jgi:hypothetical protein
MCRGISREEIMTRGVSCVCESLFLVAKRLYCCVCAYSEPYERTVFPRKKKICPPVKKMVIFAPPQTHTHTHRVVHLQSTAHSRQSTTQCFLLPYFTPSHTTERPSPFRLLLLLVGKVPYHNIPPPPYLVSTETERETSSL